VSPSYNRMESLFLKAVSNYTDKGPHLWSLLKELEKTIDDDDIFMVAAYDYMGLISMRIDIEDDIKEGRYLYESSRFVDIKEEILKSMRDRVREPQVAIGDIVCPKCKGKRIYVVQAQTRSADEGMTNFYTCMACNYSWSLNN
jgi:DNA-directed RNA polymerase subunit M/transcription elongation factor TFIIS